MSSTSKTVAGLFLGVGLALAAGCGTDSSQQVRVVVQGIDEHDLLDATGEVSSGDAELYSVLMRFATVTVTTDTEEHICSMPVNADLFDATIVFEHSIGGNQVESVTLELTAPESTGVVSDELASVYVAGLVEEERFAYVDAAMEPITIPLTIEISDELTSVFVFFDVHDWFDELDHEALAVDQSPPYRIDADTMPELAQTIEEAIHASVRQEAEDPESSESSESESH